MVTTPPARGSSSSHVRLSLHRHHGATEWRLYSVTRVSGELNYTRLRGGTLPGSLAGPRGLLMDLVRVVWELRRVWGVPLEPEAPREPLGGGGGDVPLPTLEPLGWAHSYGLRGDVPPPQ